MKSAPSITELFLLSILVVSGCSPLAPQPDQSKFYVLTAAVGHLAAPPATPGEIKDHLIGLGPIHFPGYLERDQIVTRVAPNQLDISENKVWAEPLANNFARVLSIDLSEQLASDRFVKFPWYSTTPIEYQVRIDVLRFEASADRNAWLAARWSIEDRHGKSLYANDTTLKEAIKIDEPAPEAAALSRVLADFSRVVAGRLGQLRDD
ncbi:MAG: membrane integrity-associated transporter subunit PqiC [Candidatus Binataceae bacterium]|nr:membrane integrity-associated transporter subunit PqiC [Candidatus Binataceae bacterium]